MNNNSSSKYGQLNKVKKKKSNRGAAMIVVVCVMAVTMILSLTLLMSAYQMLATVNDEGRDELYYQQAMSFSEVLRTRLEGKGMSGVSSDPLVAHIDSFMSNSDADAPDKEYLSAGANGVYGAIDMTLDRNQVFRGDLVITISVSDGDHTMASCVCRYAVTDNGGTPAYEFKGYYDHYTLDDGE
ncbi:MAG: hypothetical protein IJ232_04305 [Lachnospiraceae bacterium]|nr:hypothetical protein [Lachnospiraceae bacterium]